MTERQKLVKHLDDIVSKIVRARDKKCITCTGRNETAGHFMHRRHLGTRWSLVNVNAQCQNCNGRDDSAIYEVKMIQKYGREAVEEIKFLAHSNVKLSNTDLRELYNELKQLI